MSTLYPLVFEPQFKERVWGGRKLEQVYRKALPPRIPIGESWEIVDRPGDVSVIANGPWAGRDLRWLMERHSEGLLGESSPVGRFPLLVKLLDCREKLSLQVHPPLTKAKQFEGEPKTEMWYVAEADPGAELYAGLKRGTSRQEFEALLRQGTVERCFHRIPVRAGDVMFLPSGRVHALGAGLLIFEIQQNSDTTFRVFDWNRVGLDGQPRTLHVQQSLECIDFGDFEPALATPEMTDGNLHRLVRHELFTVDLFVADRAQPVPLSTRGMRIVGVAEGKVRVSGGGETVILEPGQFCLVPAGLAERAAAAEPNTRCLIVQLGRAAT